MISYLLSLLLYKVEPRAFHHPAVLLRVFLYVIGTETFIKAPRDDGDVPNSVPYDPFIQLEFVIDLGMTAQSKQLETLQGGE